MGRASVRVLCLFVAMGSVSSAANAASASDGCTQLATAVGDNLQSAMRQYLLDSPSLTATSAPALRVASGSITCGTTAAAASAVFSSVLRQYGWQLDWGNGGLPSPGDYCESHYLSQCYPELQHGTFGLAAIDQTFVSNAWHGLSSGLARHMPFGPQSDIAFFQAGELGTTLEISLDLSLAPSPLPARRVIGSRVAGGRR